MTRFVRPWRLIAAIAAGSLLGCATDSHVEKHWSEALRLNMAAMIANPEAPSGNAPQGLDPISAEEVAKRYYEGQSRQPVRKIEAVVIAE